jgi:DNA polymerase III epsilon subunit-like protein
LWFGLRGKLAGEALAIYDSHQVQILKALFEDYSIPWPSFNYMLVLDMVRKYLPALPDYGLPTVARYLNIFVIASEPTSRAMACGDILLAWNNGSIQSRKPVRPTLRLRVDGDGDG